MSVHRFTSKRANEVLAEAQRTDKVREFVDAFLACESSGFRQELARALTFRLVADSRGEGINITALYDQDILRAVYNAVVGETGESPCPLAHSLSVSTALKRAKPADPSASEPDPAPDPAAEDEDEEDETQDEEEEAKKEWAERRKLF